MHNTLDRDALDFPHSGLYLPASAELFYPWWGQNVSPLKVINAISGAMDHNH